MQSADEHRRCSYGIESALKKLPDIFQRSDNYPTTRETPTGMIIKWAGQAGARSS